MQNSEKKHQNVLKTEGADLAILFRVLLTSTSEALFKYPKFNNYSFKNSTITIFNTQLFIQNLLIKVEALVNISLLFILISFFLYF